MSVRVHSQGWACVDCLMLLANGEVPEVQPGYGFETQEAVDAWLAKIEWNCEGLEVVLGGEHTVDCPNMGEPPIPFPKGSRRYRRRVIRRARAWFPNGHPRRVWQGTTDCDCERLEFSWSPCSVCRSPLGGSREAVTFFERGEG